MYAKYCMRVIDVVVAIADEKYIFFCTGMT